jgi:hypothetical protein
MGTGNRVMGRSGELKTAPPAALESSLDAAIRDLGSTTCLCGMGKQKRRAFCQECFYALPRGLRNRLRGSSGATYGEMYRQAGEFLRTETRRIGATQF